MATEFSSQLTEITGGSLTVQILGSPPEKSSKKNGDRSINPSCSMTSNDQDDLSLLTVVVKSKKNDDDLFRKFVARSLHYNAIIQEALLVQVFLI